MQPAHLQQAALNAMSDVQQGYAGTGDGSAPAQNQYMQVQPAYAQTPQHTQYTGQQPPLQPPPPPPHR